MSKKNEQYYNHKVENNIATTPPTLRTTCNSGYDDDGKEFYLVNLDQNASATLGTAGYIKLTNTEPLNGGILYVMDFNGDGKTDVLSVFPDYSYKVVGFKQLLSAPWVELEVLGSGYMYFYAADKPTLFGDYNGDGKMDLMVPESVGSANWHIYYSNQRPDGGEFFKREMHYGLLAYEPQEHPEYTTQAIFNEYYATDVNKDGKADLLRIRKRTFEQGIADYDSWDSEYFYQVYANNIGNPGMGNTFNNVYSSPMYSSSLGGLPISIFANPKYCGMNQEFVMLWNHNQLHYVTFTKDVRKDNRIISISESGGNIVHDIEYKQMIAPYSGLGTITDFYSSSNSSIYPNVELTKLPDNYLVSKLTATVNGSSKFQSFKYRGLVVNLSGVGMLGFNKTARSSWYTGSGTNKIWSCQESDPSLRGANTVTWSTTDEATMFADNPNNLLSKKTNTFSDNTSASGVYQILLDAQNSTDFQNNVTISSINTYDPDGYGLVTKNVTRNLSGSVVHGTTTTDTQYASNPTGTGNNYFIGRPTQVNTETKVYVGTPKEDIRTSEEKYTYTGFDLTKTEVKGHQTDALITEMTYNEVGAMLTKTVSMPTSNPTVASRMITDEYEPTKRFVNKKIDHQGFVTLLQYNNVGQVKKSTDYLGVIKEFDYDDWGKVTQSKTTNASAVPLITTFGYTKLSNGGYIVKRTNTWDNAESKVQYDVLGRVVKETTKGFANNTTISNWTEYDALGRKVKQYEPYFASTPGKYTEYTYDNLHRPLTIKLPTNRLQTIDYSEGLKTKTLDHQKLMTATIDAMGNKVQTTDPKGTVNFMYYANGALRESDFDGHKIKTAIDGWGNKTSVFDPNAGTYTTDYDGFGQIIHETTPKGYTNYTYDDFGKLITKKISGDGADYEITYTYNAYAQLINETSRTSAQVIIDSYDYDYDSLHRLFKTTENTAGLEHSSTIEFDNFSRIFKETNYTREKVSGSDFSSTVITKHLYNSYNGILYKITDGNNNLIWELNSANEKMQTLTATLGNAVNIANTYNDNFYLTSQRHSKNNNNLLNNTYQFDAVTGTLTNRRNLNIGLPLEEFSYDDMDRLYKWTDPATGNDDLNTYDDRGRIISNNKLGTLTYNPNLNTGIYQKTNIRLNPSGSQYYGALGGSQIASYTMFKSPILITESNKGKVNF
jgi:YD repeat-containing protein